MCNHLASRTNCVHIKQQQKRERDESKAPKNNYLSSHLMTLFIFSGIFEETFIRYIGSLLCSFFLQDAIMKLLHYLIFRYIELR